MPVINCRHFSGYKPCSLNTVCDSKCPHQSVPSFRLLIIHLGAIGAVVRSTALLAPILRKYPNAHITWVTQSPSHQLLIGHSQIDRVLTTRPEDVLTLSALEFDAAFCIDKSLAAVGILKQTKAKQVFGFTADSQTGAILPATEDSKYLWQLGLSNQEKFFVNKKPETQLVAEALGLEYRRDPYNVELSESEVLESLQRRKKWASPQEIIVGFNTGCSDVIPYKKLTVDMHRDLIQKVRSLGVKVVLLGGPEDRIRNQQIAHGQHVVSSPTDRGLRDGLLSVSACDIVVTGDSLGMHMSVALGKWTVAWFGPTCEQEIDLYDKGVKVLTQATCSPCWKRSCLKNPMCYDLVSSDEILDGVKKGIQWLMSSSTPRLSVISSYQSPYLSRSKKNLQVSL